MDASLAVSCARTIRVCTTLEEQVWAYISAGNWLNTMRGVSGSNRSKARGLHSMYRFLLSTSSDAPCGCPIGIILPCSYKQLKGFSQVDAWTPTRGVATYSPPAAAPLTASPLSL